MDRRVITEVEWRLRDVTAKEEIATMLKSIWLELVRGNKNA